MRFAIQIPFDRVDLGDEFASPSGAADCAAFVETAGFAAAFVTDHPIPEDSWLRKGGHHSLDPFVALAFMAASTQRLRLMTNILVLPYRNPFLVAKSVASLDTLSGGRLILGVGAGYLAGEFSALGVDLQNRGRAMDESLRVIRLALSGESVTYQGEGFQATGNTMLPRCVQLPMPPVWIGGNSRSAKRRAAQYGEGWMPFPVQGKFAAHVRTAEIAGMEDLAAAIAELRQLERDYGRNAPLDICMIPFGLDMHSTAALDAGGIVEQCLQLAELGVTWISLSPRCDSRRQFKQTVDWLAANVLSKLP